MKFQTYLVDEFRTRYSSCIKTMVRKNPRLYRTRNVIVHGLIYCKTDAVIGIET